MCCSRNVVESSNTAIQKFIIILIIITQQNVICIFCALIFPTLAVLLIPVSLAKRVQTPHTIYMTIVKQNYSKILQSHTIVQPWAERLHSIPVLNFASRQLSVL